MSGMFREIGTGQFLGFDCSRRNDRLSRTGPFGSNRSRDQNVTRRCYAVLGGRVLSGTRNTKNPNTNRRRRRIIHTALSKNPSARRVIRVRTRTVWVSLGRRTLYSLVGYRQNEKRYGLCVHVRINAVRPSGVR